MYKTLCPGAIGIKTAKLGDALRLARLGNFAGLEVSAAEIAELVDERGAGMVQQLFTDARIRPAAVGLPVDWRTSDENWRRDLEKLPRLAKAAAAIGINRTFTWVMPCSNERAMDANLAFHIERFTPIARTLAQYNIRLGLEFIGPKTLRESQTFPFIYKMRDMLDLGKQIGENVGILLDCWHWYTSHGTLEEIANLRPERIVYVHVNDAPRGIAIDEQIDQVRDLPGATGVIDIAGFLKVLKAIGYDGPVTPEPFKKELAEFPSDEARVKTVAGAMDEIFRRAGLSV